jgi:hypothetical protein
VDEAVDEADALGVIVGVSVAVEVIELVNVVTGVDEMVEDCDDRWQPSKSPL